MKLSEYKLGELIELNDTRNDDEKFTLDDVRGISIQKIFIDTKADMSGVSLKPYIIVKPDAFAYVTVTSRNGGKITLAHNDSDNVYIVSSSYVVFSVKRPDILCSDYLFMYFNRPEFDRYARFHSIGSAREVFSWEDMCAVTITLPPLSIQEKYVRIYNAVRENLRVYERGLDDLKLVCEGFIEESSKKNPARYRLGDFIQASTVNNRNLQYGADLIQGVSSEGEFMLPNRDTGESNLRLYKIVNDCAFVYNPTVLNTGSIAYRTEGLCIVSHLYIVFYLNEEGRRLINPLYLFTYFRRKEFGREVNFRNFGSARPEFSFQDMCDVSIPIPSLEIQESIANIYKVYQKRKSICEKLKSLIKSICPVLIKGALDEAHSQEGN